MADNPYKSPMADVSAIGPMLSSGAVTEGMLRYLRGASPWMRFIGILGFISSGFFAFVGLLLFFVPTALVSLSGELAEAGLAFVGGAFAGLIYIGLAALGFLPARFLYRSGAGMRRFARTGSGAELEEALRCNKAFWKFVGIVLIIQLALVPVTIVLVTIVAIGSVM